VLTKQESAAPHAQLDSGRPTDKTSPVYHDPIRSTVLEMPVRGRSSTPALYNAALRLHHLPTALTPVAPAATSSYEHSAASWRI